MERKGTFKELIYTRCGAGYSIRGEENPGNNGYAIFNSSRELWSQLSDSDLQYAERIIARQFQWSYGCPVKRSWSYLLLPHGREGVFADLYAYTEEDGANNSESSNMRGSHLAQMLCGIPSMYPYELIRSPYFTARQQASTDAFYLRECAPRLPDIPQSSIPAGSITPGEIQSFLAGREQAVQGCVAWLIEQMGKQPKERRPIIILDQADRIPLWIAAITCHFPLSMACQLPFYTCREGLERVNAAAFYRVDAASGDFVPQVNMQDPSQESRPLAMLLGCALEDTEAARAVANLPADASCVLLDGGKGQLRFTPDSRILSSPYVSRIISGRSSLLALLPSLNELKDVPFSADFLPLFDALASLSSRAQPPHKDLISGIRTLLPHADRGCSSLLRVLNAMLGQGDYLSFYAAQDASEGYPLLGELIRMTDIWPDYSKKLQDAVLSCLKSSLQSPSLHPDALWSLLRSKASLAGPVLNTLFEEEHLSFLTPEACEKLSPQSTVLLFQMQDEHISAQPQRSWADLVSSPGPVMAVLFQRSIQAPEIRKPLVSLLKKDTQALESYVLGGALMAGKTPGERADWWKDLQEDGCPLEQELHAIQLSRQLTSRDLEMAMTASLRRQGLNSSLIRLYEQHLARIPDCGSEFFEEALRYSLKSRSTALLEELWNATRLDAQTEERTRQLLSAADQQITMNESQENAALVRFVDEHAAGQSWPHTDVYQFLSQMTAKSSITSLLHRPQSVILPAWQKANPQFTVFPVNQDLASAGMGKALLEKAADHSDEIASHLLIAAGFRFKDVQLCKNWIAAYIDLLISECFSAKDATLASLCALEDALENPQSISRSDAAAPLSAIIHQVEMPFVQQNAKYLLNCYRQKLAGEKKVSSYAERWISDCEQKYGSAVAARVKKYTDQAVAAYQKDNPNQGGFLSRIFGRK